VVLDVVAVDFVDVLDDEVLDSDFDGVAAAADFDSPEPEPEFESELLVDVVDFASARLSLR